MAVAVKNASEAPPHSPLDRLAVSSLLGVLYVLGSIGIVFYAVPAVWSWVAAAVGLGAFPTFGLQIVFVVLAAVGLIYLGRALMGPHPAHGLHAGVGVGVLGLLAIAFLTWAFGRMLEDLLPESAALVGAILTIAFGVGLLFLAGRVFFRTSFEETLGVIEDQGWFSWKSYKPSQGRMVRRGTIVGILSLVVTGIGTLLIHRTLESGAPNWSLKVPFLETGGGQVEYYVTLLRDVRFTVPILFAALGLWVAFRVVNFPTFADFLIATEAEMNKVSWTTRKRLWQDTVVVLVTVVLMTVFLMVVDLFWGWSLKAIGVLRFENEQQQVEQNVQPW